MTHLNSVLSPVRLWVFGWLAPLCGSRRLTDASQHWRESRSSVFFWWDMCSLSFGDQCTMYKSEKVWEGSCITEPNWLLSTSKHQTADGGGITFSVAPIPQCCAKKTANELCKECLFHYQNATVNIEEILVPKTDFMQCTDTLFLLSCR